MLTFFHFYITFSQELLKEFEVSNGTTHLANSTSPKKKQTEESTQQEMPEQSVTCEGNEATDKKKEKGCGLSSVKQMSRQAASMMSVENPNNIDRHARVYFPMVFLIVNIFYWLYYLLF